MTSVISRKQCIALLAATLLIFNAEPIAGQSSKKKDNSKKRLKEVCISFVGLPVAKGFDEVDRTAITYLILDALKRHDVKATGFVIGNNIEGAYDILGQWLNDGHKLGSMSQTNEDFHGLSIQKCIVEIRTGAESLEQMLLGFGQKKRYFRYPYLHYGTTIEARRQTNMFIEAHGMVLAHASTLPEDYLYNLSLDKLGRQPDSVEYIALMNEYVNHVLDEMQRVEFLGSKIVGSSFRQILSLTANRLNAVFLDDLLGAVEEFGYRFISLDRALADKLYEIPEAYYRPLGVGYVDMIALSDPDLVPAR